MSAVHNRESLTRRWLESLLARGSQGAILVLSELSERQRAELSRRSMPFVVVDGVSQPPPDVPSIGATNFAGGYAATEHLLGLGHRRIGVIGGPTGCSAPAPASPATGPPWSAAGIAADRRAVRYGNFHHAGGLRGDAALLALPDPPTAMFAGSDQQAIGVYEAVRQRGRASPRRQRGRLRRPAIRRVDGAAADHGPPAAARDGRRRGPHPAAHRRRRADRVAPHRAGHRARGPGEHRGAGGGMCRCNTSHAKRDRRRP